MQPTCACGARLDPIPKETQNAALINPGCLSDHGVHGVLVCCKWCTPSHVQQFCCTDCPSRHGHWTRGNKAWRCSLWTRFLVPPIPTQAPQIQSGVEGATLVVPFKEGWKAVFPPSGGDPYFWHEGTGTVQWESPTATPTPPAPAVQGAATPTPPAPAAQGEEQQDDNRVACRICWEAVPQTVSNCGHGLCIDCYTDYHVERNRANCCFCGLQVSSWTRIYL